VSGCAANNCLTSDYEKPLPCQTDLQTDDVLRHAYYFVSRNSGGTETCQQRASRESRNSNQVIIHSTLHAEEATTSQA